MNSSDLFFILKKLLTSPIIIGVIIFAILYLKLSFFILHYKKKSNWNTKSNFNFKASKEAKPAKADKQEEPKNSNEAYEDDSDNDEYTD